MKLELSIADDRELRDFIKDSIRGEVVSIARGEIKSIIADVVRQGIIPATPEDANRLVREIVKDEVRSAIRATSWGTPEEIKKILREEIRKFLNEAFMKGIQIE